MMATHARPGRVEAICLRAERRAEVQSVTEAEIDEEGLVGDHGRAGKRAVTLVQFEHLDVVAALLGRADVDPRLLRRNLVVSGLNLLGLRKRAVEVGTARLYIEGPCPPCSRMEEALGPGGYSALRGHGGVYASVLRAGIVGTGDAVTLSAV